jgi:hypothetical protein
MGPTRLKEHTNVAINTVEVRRACAALERLRSAIGILHGLPPECLEVMKDYVIKECLPRKGPEHLFAVGYLRLVETELENKKRLERQLYNGITGENYKDSAR